MATEYDKLSPEEFERRRMVRNHKNVQDCLKSTAQAKKDLLASIKRIRKLGWTYNDIAVELNLSPSRVQQLVRQADGRGRSNR